MCAIRRCSLCVLRGYRLWNRYHGKPSCRFHPTCSDYAEQALQQLGVWMALWLILCRLLRCHPFANAGFDPLPSSPSFFSFLKGSSR